MSCFHDFLSLFFLFFFFLSFFLSFFFIFIFILTILSMRTLFGSGHTGVCLALVES